MSAYLDCSMKQHIARQGGSDGLTIGLIQRSQHNHPSDASPAACKPTAAGATSHKKTKPPSTAMRRSDNKKHAAHPIAHARAKKTIQKTSDTTSNSSSSSSSSSALHLQSNADTTTTSVSPTAASTDTQVANGQPDTPTVDSCEPVLQNGQLELMEQLLQDTRAAVLSEAEAQQAAHACRNVQHVARLTRRRARERRRHALTEQLYATALERRQRAKLRLTADPPAYRLISQGVIQHIPAALLPSLQQQQHHHHHQHDTLLVSPSSPLLLPVASAGEAARAPLRLLSVADSAAAPLVFLTEFDMLKTTTAPADAANRRKVSPALLSCAPTSAETVAAGEARETRAGEGAGKLSHAKPAPARRGETNKSGCGSAATDIVHAALSGYRSSRNKEQGHVAYGAESVTLHDNDAKEQASDDRPVLSTGREVSAENGSSCCRSGRCTLTATQGAVHRPIRRTPATELWNGTRRPVISDVCSAQKKLYQNYLRPGSIGLCPRTNAGRT